MSRSFQSLVLVAITMVASACTGSDILGPVVPSTTKPKPEVFADTTGLSAGALALVRPSIQANGTIVRWPDGKQIRVYADSTVIHQEDLVIGLSFWAKIFKKDTSKVTESPTQADMVLRQGIIHGLSERSCASAGLTKVEGSVVVASEGNFANGLKPGVCSFYADSALITHELGHALGLEGHSLLPLDVMFASFVGLKSSPALDEAVGWLESYQPGTRVR